MRYLAYLNMCSQVSANYSASELRDIMRSFEKVLFEHLDEEVQSLKGENMSK